MAKQELLATIRDRYRASSKREKSRILDEFIAVTGHHRKHGIRLLGQSGDDGEQQPAVKKGRRIYDESVRQALIVVWEAADRICGKRLKAALPHLVESMERLGHWSITLRMARFFSTQFFSSHIFVNDYNPLTSRIPPTRGISLRNRSASIASSLVSHSQTVMTFQPSSRNWLYCQRSRLIFSLNLASQKARLLLGV